jgi:translation initiation factor IF-2
MAEGPSKTSAQEDAEGGVLAGLPATRPNRMGRRSRDAGGAAKPRPKRAAKPKAAAKPGAAAKSRPKAKTRPKPAAKPAAKRAAAPVAEEPTPIREPRRPRPVRAGHPGLDAASERERPADQDGAGLAGNVVAAAGDVAAVGVKIGGRVLKGIAGRLSK